ncbi:hypothetical protein BCV69DRAFT_129866 [Microstroma glucosiphilum]|uniref:Uncharacterized protein n=1 Tax=Pseudomicrostroma glucosiphilum TaxID=1684307 RepID=A0A316TWW9_9BASI|nr:hypothetical protein BCV69DRAFT_129866 [Pseudomicrostroma glucosiphilum]PWN17700.1 hypothetical protein BCV69DRAFT_129866 [Pseudomicrostroma glucosiphilum]
MLSSPDIRLLVDGQVQQHRTHVRSRCRQHLIGGVDGQLADFSKSVVNFAIRQVHCLEAEERLQICFQSPQGLSGGSMCFKSSRTAGQSSSVRSSGRMAMRPSAFVMSRTVAPSLWSSLLKKGAYLRAFWPNRSSSCMADEAHGTLELSYPTMPIVSTERGGFFGDYVPGFEDVVLLLCSGRARRSVRAPKMAATGHLARVAHGKRWALLAGSSRRRLPCQCVPACPPTRLSWPGTMRCTPATPLP